MVPLTSEWPQQWELKLDWTGMFISNSSLLYEITIGKKHDYCPQFGTDDCKTKIFMHNVCELLTKVLTSCTWVTVHCLYFGLVIFPYTFSSFQYVNKNCIYGRRPYIQYNQHNMKNTIHIIQSKQWCDQRKNISVKFKNKWINISGN